MAVTPTDIQNALVNVTDQTSFIQGLLRDVLEWNIADATKVKDLGYDWYLDDDFKFTDEDRRNLMGMEVVQIPITREINLFGEETPGKWGVFVLTFKDAQTLKQGRGLTSPLRKMLRALMKKKADLPSFSPENILFICADPSFQNVTFARFKKVPGKSVAPLATFGWTQDEKNAVRTLCEHNLPNLHWGANWGKAFDIEAVTKAFYNEIFIWFENAQSKAWFPLKNAVKILDRKEEDLQSEALIRLVIRLIFIWFMKEKQELVPEALFDRKDVDKFLRHPIGGDNDQGHTYYNAVLQNLFFATLNCPQEKRKFRADHDINDKNRTKNERGISILYRFKDKMSDPDGLADLFAQVPFLNGGLFTCHDDIRKFVFGEARESYHLDGFSENDKDQAILPDELFFAPDKHSGLLDILKRYHFTIEEHTPLEQEVALDPELLGHVFENLLAAYTPESKETARKKTGSYYTPRNIVDYMVGESLKHYLAWQMGWENDTDQQSQLEILLDYEQDESPFSDEDNLRLRNALYNVKIFDPACGSGAFPMGALQRLNHVLEKLNEEASSYERKLKMISNNIFGTDIQPIATEITTQRFFISLLIDQDVNKKLPNCGIRPLPNLEVKFMTANTLLSLNWKTETSLRKGTQDDIFYRGIDEQVNIIKQIFVDYLTASSAKEKDELRGHFANEKQVLLNEFASNAIPEKDRETFKAWEPFGFSKSAKFFDPQLMFGFTRPDGFDIVIGNPPYVRHEKIKDQKPALKEEFGKFFKGTADLYTYFYAKGIELLKPNGILAYITPNKFMSTSYGDKTRQLLSTQAHPKVLIDFNETPVFEATTYPLIAILQKGQAKPETTFTSLPEKELRKGDWKDPATAIAEHSFVQPVSSLKDTGWILERPEVLQLLDKFKHDATLLGEYVEGKFYRGILTGYNDVFELSEDDKETLIKSDPNSVDLIKPWLRGREINKWSMKTANSYILNIQSSSNHTWVWTGKPNREDIFSKKYSSVYNYLTLSSKALAKIKNRSDQGQNWWELRACAYDDAFSEPKIIFPNMANEPQFCLDRTGTYINQKGYFIAKDDSFLLGVLNSRVISFWCWFTLPKLMGATMEFNKDKMKNLPIPKATEEQKAQVAALANQIIDLKDVIPDADVSKLEAQIDEIVYELFNLNQDEIHQIENLKKQ